MKETDFDLRVPRKLLADALRLLSRTVERRPGEEAVLSFDEANLHIELGGGGVAVPATGYFDGQVLISGKTLLKLAKLLPDGDPVRFRVKGNDLTIQSLLIPCKVQQPWLKNIDLPINATGKKAAEMLALEPVEDLLHSGLLEIAGGLAGDIREAARILGKHGVTEADLEQLVRSKEQPAPPDESRGQ